MIPNSRKVLNRAYRTFLTSILNDRIVSTALYGRGNKLITRGVDISIKNIGTVNTIDIQRQPLPHKTTKVNNKNIIELNIGDMNNIQIELQPTVSQDNTISLKAGNNNIVKAELSEADNISIGNSNTILGKLDTANKTQIGNNNILINFSAEIKEGTIIRGTPKKWSLKVDTKISKNAEIGQNYIEVKDTTHITSGRPIFFGSIGAAYVERVVTGVKSNRVYFKEVLKAKELAYIGAEVFNRYYEALDKYEGFLLKSPKKGSRVIYLSNKGNLRLREVKIGDNFITKILFIRESDNMAIIDKLIDQDLQSGFPIVAQKSNPYEQLTIQLVEKKANNKYIVSSSRDISIGRSALIDKDVFTVVGFGEDYIVFDKELPDNTQNITFSAIDNSRGGDIVVSRTTTNISGSSPILYIEEPKKFYIGQKIEISSANFWATITDIGDNYIQLNRNMFPTQIENKFYIGTYELERNMDTAKENMTKAMNNLHEYIFGGIE